MCVLCVYVCVCAFVLCGALVLFHDKMYSMPLCCGEGSGDIPMTLE
jgi:hypothetical protein